MTSTIRVLVFDPESDDRASLAAELQRSGHEPVIAEDVDAAVRALAHQRVDVSVVGVRAHDVTALAALRRASRSTHIMAVGRELTESDIDAVHEAGADSDIRGPTDSQRLIGRIQAVLRRAERTPIATSSLAPPVTDGPADVVFASMAWRNAPSLLQIATSQTLALPVAVGNAGRIRAPLACGSVIDLVSATQGVELHIAVGADLRSARSLATHMLGCDDECATSDVLNELANVYMGALKRALSDEGLDFTGGLPAPRTDAPFVDLAMQPCSIHTTAFALLVHEAPLLVRLLVRSRNNMCVGREELREGLVLAQDVFSPRGVRLLENGTRLSQHAVDRLRAVLTSTTEIEVMQ